MVATLVEYLRKGAKLNSDQGQIMVLFGVFNYRYASRYGISHVSP